MIQDNMIGEIQELKLAGYTHQEVHEELGKRHKKVPTLKTACKCGARVNSSCWGVTAYSGTL